LNSWYVIQTKPKKEEEATSYLARKGVEVYQPVMETYLGKRGRLDRGIKPLFPGYIFGNFNLVQDYTLVKWARGVKKILGNGGSPTPIAEKVICEIKGRSDGEGVVRLDRRFFPHDPVRITGGPFKDFLGIFEGWIPEKDRVRILLNLIGYQPKVDLHFSMVEKMH
jgi:transcriptional antiterminator RfaH